MSQSVEVRFPAGLTLWVEGENLKYKVKKGSLSQEALLFLKTNKNTLLNLLKINNASSVCLFPLAENQKALWFLYKLAPLAVPYNVALSFKIKNGYNETHIKKSLETLISRHWPLQSQFVDISETGQNIYHFVFNTLKPFFETIDCTGQSEDIIKEQVIKKYKSPFNLEKDSPIKCTLFKASRESVLLINVHHIVCDALSLKYLFDQFIKVYHDLEEGKKIGLNPADTNYKNYLDRQTFFLQNKESEQQLKYWQKELNNAVQYLNLVTDFERPPVPSFKGDTIYFQIKDEQYVQINQFIKREKTSAFVFFFTLYELFLAKESSQDDFCIGTPFAARTDHSFENNFGYFVNMLPLHCQLPKTYHFSEQLKLNKKKIILALENQDYPFPLLVEKLKPNRSLSKSPFFQVMFNLLNRKTMGSLVDILNVDDKKTIKLGSLLLKPFKINDQEGQFDQTFEIIDDDSAFNCALKYNTDLYKNKTIIRFKKELLEWVDFVLNNQNSLIKLDFNDYDKAKVSDQSEKTEVKLNITGTFSVENLVPFFEFWFDQMDYKHNVHVAGYNQVEQQLLNPESDFRKNSYGYNMICLQVDDWLHKEKGNFEKSINIKQAYEKLKQFGEALRTYNLFPSSAILIICICPSSPQSKSVESLNRTIEEIENKIKDIAHSYPSVYCITFEDINKNYPITEYYEPLGHNLGHMPYKEDFLLGLATLMSRKIFTNLNVSFKALILDCDGTLWKGVVGEDGVEGLIIGDSELALQQFAIDLYNKGFIICLCSKNEESEVFQVFQENENMVLKNEHIAFKRINWNSKPENILSLVKEMKIGLNSVVFIDDNPIECASVNAYLPEAVAIQKDNNLNHIDYIKNSFAFDFLRLTEEDKLRSKRYVESINRKAYEQNTLSFSDFIKGLNLEVAIQALSERNIPRVSQLSFRTNQFNVTTLRRNEGDLKKLLLTSGIGIYTVHLKDRFGDYGLIGVMITKEKKSSLFVDSFFISCRALGKGVEYKMIHFLANQANKKKINNIEFPFTKTQKNQPAEQFLMTHFGAYKKKVDELHFTFIVPIKTVLSVLFDPENKIFKQTDMLNLSNEEFNGSRTGDIRISNDVLNRNRFIFNVTKKYYNLGKIKEALSKGNEEFSISSHTITPNSETEIKLLNQWHEVLDRNSISIDDNFFDIGGHSVLIPQILINLKKKENIDLQIVHIFQYPTIKSLASFIDGSSSDLNMKGIQMRVNKQKSALKNQKQKAALIRMKKPRE